MNKSAFISRCGRYRYTLTRTWDSKAAGLLVIGLNPSTADATQDDPTIRQCIGFARSWGFGTLWMANAFAYRATRIPDMLETQEPVGRLNDKYIRSLSMNPRCSMILAAWTKHARHRGREQQVLELLEGFDIYCLGTNNDGSPKHPLYLAASTKPVLYVP